MAANTSKNVYTVWEQVSLQGKVPPMAILSVHETLDDAKEFIKTISGISDLVVANRDVKLNRFWQTEWVNAPANGESAFLCWGIAKVKFHEKK